jgi:MoxR-like ATPase
MSTPTSVTAAVVNLQQVEMELRNDLYEREEAIRAALVALVARTHLVLLGPPGTAKSELIRLIADRICDPNGQGLSSFVYLLTRFTTPEELFGPVAVSKLKNDEYERKTKGKLPEAQLVFLDEVFKSSSAVLNSLLTLMNERIFYNGDQVMQTDIMSFLCASNEMPQGDDLEALWDRFLLRLEVGYLSESNFEKLLQSRVSLVSGNQGSARMSQTELRLLQEHAARLPIPPAILTALATLRRDLQVQKGIIASDRRWVQCLRVLQAHAVIEGRDVVEEDDLALLSLALWRQPEERAEISRMVTRLANPLNAKAHELKDLAVSLWREAQGKMRLLVADEQASARAQIALETLGKVKRVVRQLEGVKVQATEQLRPLKRIDQALARVHAIRKEIIESSDL